ncbi:uncharacterized protein LODBEIA_P14790 [Lodderomyces beijingensis]|uniref:Ubiquitin-like protein ATG12 n=1 Tax=Lodderomyces beijingensis TaxID=1775926 RepID=A0ABP0ZGG2_9ASCO
MATLRESSILQSDPDSDSDGSDESRSSSSLNESSDAQHIADDAKTEAKVPLSTSMMLEKLPPEHQRLLDRTLRSRNEDTNEKSNASWDKGHSHLDSAAVAATRPVQEIQEITKISIRLQPIGSTRAILPKVFKILSTQSVSTVNRFLCRKLRSKEPFHLYIHNSFSPLPDEKVGDLYNMFKTNNELIISYCNTLAFG